MSDVMAIVSKAVFEEAAGKAPTLGTVLGMDRYVSANKGLAPLTGGGTLYLVTVRPPDEALWLVAVLPDPTFSGSAWVATPSTLAMTDISPLKSQFVFENGKGLPAEKGKLGMSLQTPRVLVASDVALLSAAPSGSPVLAPPADAATALRAAVIAAPTDDHAKRALAAYWTGVGEPRGELVVVDLELRGRPSVSRRRELTRRRHALLAEHAARWWPYGMASRQRGGFLSAVSADLATLLEQGKALFATEPVTEVEVTNVDEGSVADLAKAPWLARVQQLAVRGQLGDEGFATLVGSKHAEGLRALNVGGTGISDLAALGSKLPHLRRLVLTNNPLGDDGVASLLKWKHLPQLTTLYLTACEVTDEGIRELFASGRLGALEKLTLGSNEELGDAGLAAVAAATIPRLAYLELGNLDVSGAVDAFTREKFPALRHFDRA